MRRSFLLLLAALMILLMPACGGDEPVVMLPTEPDEPEETIVDQGELVILFTGNLQGIYAGDQILGTVGYANLVAYADSLRDDGAQVILVDGGCSMDAKGLDGLWKIVDQCGYDFRVPGAVELASGGEILTARADDLKDCAYISCNLIDSNSGETVFEPYALVEAGSVRVGFVGVTNPHALGQSARDYEILGAEDPQILYDTVQQAVDAAADAGADYVVVVGNLGTAPEDSPLTTVEVISNITGMAAWLDCGSGAVLDGDILGDKDDYEIPLCAPGSEFRYVGQVVLDLNDGSATVELLSEFSEEDRTVRSMVDDLDDE